MKNDFKSRLRAKEVLLGPMLTLPSPEVAEMMALAGFDWVWIELEHSPADVLTAQRMVQAVGDRCPCIVRAPWNDAVWIKRVLDTGCDGIVIPQIQSAAEAENAIRACRYPPVGIRGVGVARAQQYGMNLLDYIAGADAELTVVLQVEHVEGVKNVREIVDVPGIDAIVIGPLDLTASMGLVGQFGHPDVKNAIHTVVAACAERGVPVGIFANDPASARTYIEAGCNLIVLSADCVYLWQAVRRAIGEVRHG